MILINLINLFRSNLSHSNKTRYTYRRVINNDEYFFLYFKEFDEIHVMINKDKIVIFKSHGKFSTQREFEEYHGGYFNNEDCEKYFLNEVKKKSMTQKQKIV